MLEQTQGVSSHQSREKVPNKLVSEYERFSVFN